MKDIAIYGAGGFGREVACLINLINKEKPTWNLIGFFDDGKEKGSRNEYGELLGGLYDLNSYDKPLDIAIAIGNPAFIKRVAEGITNPNIDFPNIIAPNVQFMDIENMSLGKGNIICSGCWISCNVHIGNFNIFNVGISIGHDACLGNYNALMPSVNISGEVIIRDENFFGVAAVVLQQKKIGRNTTIGANSLIIKNTKDEKIYMGVPATAL